MNARETCPCGDGPRPGHPDGWCGQGQPKTVRVRIAVAVDENGNYAAHGNSIDGNMAHARWARRDLTNAAEGGAVRIEWVEADVPLPLPPQTIQGSVTPAEEG